jgi:CubicO group peptidase (beta-lactamase class C family)
LRRLRTASLVAASTIVFSCHTTTPQPIRLDAELESIRVSSRPPGLAASIRRANAAIASGAAGVRRLGGRPVGPDDAFHIGSVTKPFTATLAGILVAEGRLTWETKLSDVLPELRAAMRSEYADVTLADLLSHESGLPPFEEDHELAGLRFDGPPMEQRRAFVRHVVGLAPAVPRGTFRYSNAGFTAAAVMVETIEGRSWEELIERRIARPLGLKSLGFGWPARRDPNQPWGHQESAEGQLEPHDPNGEYQLPPILAPAGNLHMSMEDLALFLADHLRALRGERALLPPAVARTMHTPRAKSGLGFGVGKVGNIEPVSTFAGSAGTFLALIAIAPEHDVAVAVAANAADGQSDAALKSALKQFLQRFAAKQP